MTTIIHKCRICEAPAKFHCAGCDTTPLPAQHARENTWYCGRECQAKDWKDHKNHCKETKAKVDFQSLQRAANILQSLFDLYRHVGYDLSIASAERKGIVLHVKEGKYDLVNNLLPGFGHVESIPNLEPEDYAMMLTMMSCSDSLIHTYECCALFLQDTKLARVVKEVVFKPKPGPREWTMKRPWGTETSKQYPHAIHQITLKDGTQWALDLTGAQYGHKESLVPWPQYAQDRITQPTTTNHFGSSVNSWYKDCAPASPSNTTELNIKNPASIGKAITWSQYQIAQTMLYSVRDSLKALGISARDFLQMPSEAQFAATLKQIIADARTGMKTGKPTVNSMPRAHGHDSSRPNIDLPTTSNGYPVKVRVDRHGTTHFLL